MAKIEEYTVRGKTTRFTEYDTIDEIIAIIEQNDQFHDGTIEHIGHDSQCTSIGFKHYKDPEHTIRRLIFTGNVELMLNLDLLVRYIYEISYSIDNRLEFIFYGTGIIVEADNVKLQIQELLNESP